MLKYKSVDILIEKNPKTIFSYDMLLARTFSARLKSTCT